jgi:heat shock factor-binding protein 1
MPPATSAQPLKVPATPSKVTEFDKDKTPVASKQQIPSKLGTIAPSDISSPHELTAFVSS